MKKTSLFKKIGNSRVLWMIVALLASFAMWVYVISVSTDEFTQTYYNIPVELVGADTLLDSRNMVITDLDTSTVSVTVTGPRRELNSLSAVNIVAQVDVSRLTQAAFTTQQVTVSFPDGVTNNISVQRCMPETVNFMVSQNTKKTVAVRGGFEGDLAEGFTAESPVFEPATLEIYGPEVYLRNVDHAWVTFGQGVVATSSYTEDTGFILRDSNNETCSLENLSFSTETVQATLPILAVKQVPLEVNIIEGSGATKANTVVDIEPKSVTLAGDSAILDGLNQITLDTIDLTNFASTYTETYTIPIDNELKNLTGVTEATVSIQIVGLETRTFSISQSNISYTNATEGTEVTILTETLEVRLRGAPELLDLIKSENIRAIADLTDYLDATGTFMPAVKIRIDGFSPSDVGVIGQLGTYTITIEVRRTEG